MIVIGTRGSKLALAQANWVSSQLDAQGLPNRIQIIETKGDIVHERFDKMEGKGFFTSEIETALANREIDLAVHSLKDLPTRSPDGLRIAAIPERENPFDVIVSATPLDLLENGRPDLGGKRVGTSSMRRVAGLTHYYPDIEAVPIRGNVPTRIQKMRDGQVDVVILARAGLERLHYDLSDLSVYDAGPPFLVPAPGQGALALQIREDADLDLSFLHHAATDRCVREERRILEALEGGCQMPLGVLVREWEKGFRLDLFLGHLSSGFEGKAEARLFMSLEGPTPERLTEDVLEILLHPVFKG